MAPMAAEMRHEGWLLLLAATEFVPVASYTLFDEELCV
jgi:hypothetical protein